MSEKITVTYDSDWSDLTTEEEELREYGITLVEQGEPDFYGCHEITIEGDQESLMSWIDDTQDFNLQDTLRDMFDNEINRKIDIIKEEFTKFKVSHPTLHGKKLVDKFRDYLEKSLHFKEIASEDYIHLDTDEVCGVCVHYLMYCNDIEVNYDYEEEVIAED